MIFVLRNEKHAQSLWGHLKGWKEAAEQGKPLQVEVTVEGAKRSQAQNRLYWAILRTISETGWIHGRKFDQDAWHEYFKREFIGCLELPNGSTAGISTSTLKEYEFSDYIEKVRAYAARELHVEFLDMGAA